MSYNLRAGLPVGWVFALWLAVLSNYSMAAGTPGDDRLLNENEYRGDIDEVVVVGKQPAWRSKPDEEQWRPQRFELPEPVEQGRMQWFPEYTKDERDNYQGVRDRKGEKAEFKIFEWKF